MNAVGLARLVSVRARMRDAAKMELLSEESVLLDIDRELARTSDVKNDIIKEQRALQNGSSTAEDHERLDGMRLGAEHVRVLQLNKRLEQEKRIISARARLLQSEREWERSKEMLQAARDARDAAEMREMEALPRPARDPLESRR